MKAICDAAVEAAGDWWAWIGWGLFACALLVIFFAYGAPVWAGILFGALLILWWIMDAVSQWVRPWQIALGAAMLFIGLLPYGFMLILAAWALYWAKVRE